MPNWVTTIIRSKDINFEKEFKSFNNLIPMPKSLLEVTAGSESMEFDGLYKIHDGSLKAIVKSSIDKPIRAFIDEIFINESYLTVWAVEQLKKKLIQKRANVAQYYINKRRYRHSTWYDWSYEHWGTKWDMCDPSYSEDGHEIRFDTAWAFPEPIIEALAKKYPDAYFTGEFCEEQPGYYSGEFEFDHHGLDFYYDDEYSAEAYERYFGFFGGEEDYRYDEEQGTYVYIDEDEAA